MDMRWIQSQLIKDDSRDTNGVSVSYSTWPYCAV